MSDSHEVERIAELEDVGFVETSITCPECGSFLMEQSNQYVLGGEVIEEYTRECPSCGHFEMYYDE